MLCIGSLVSDLYLLVTVLSKFIAGILQCLCCCEEYIVLSTAVSYSIGNYEWSHQMNGVWFQCNLCVCPRVGLYDITDISNSFPVDGSYADSFYFWCKGCNMWTTDKLAFYYRGRYHSSALLSLLVADITINFRSQICCLGLILTVVVEVKK